MTQGSLIGLNPYVKSRLARAAKRGLKWVSNDLVIYVDSENLGDFLVTDRNKFLSIMSSCGDTLEHALNEPARVKASRMRPLTKDAVVFWFVVAEPDGVKAQVLTLSNYRLTTHFVGSA